MDKIEYMDDGSELIIKTKCKYYLINILESDNICSNIKTFNRNCPISHIEDIYCNSKGYIYMPSLYYPIYKNK